MRILHAPTFWLCPFFEKAKVDDCRWLFQSRPSVEAHIVEWHPKEKHPTGDYNKRGRPPARPIKVRISEDTG